NPPLYKKPPGPTYILRHEAEKILRDKKKHLEALGISPDKNVGIPRAREFLFLKDVETLKSQVGDKFKSLAVFDFDRTLFLCPVPSPNLWDKIMLDFLKSGFFKWEEALDNLPVELYKDNFVASALAKLNSFIEDDTCLTVVLSTKPRSIFYERIKDIFALKGVRPDLVILQETSLFPTEFKELAIFKVLGRFSSIDKIEVFDNCLHRGEKAGVLLDRLKLNGLLTQAQVYTSAIRNAYLPAELELKLVRKLMADRRQYPILINKIRKKYPVCFNEYLVRSFPGVFLTSEDTSKLMAAFTTEFEIPDEWVIQGDHVKLVEEGRQIKILEGWALGQMVELEIVAHVLYEDCLAAKVKFNPPPTNSDLFVWGKFVTRFSLL
ncbi:hypothetical protein L0F63_007415, partial [Massospora cicadina]